MKIDLSGKVALVTGGGAGLGRAMSLILAEHGAKVAINYLNSRQQAEETVESIRKSGGQAIAIQADVTDLAQIDRLVVEAETALGSIDILVNNAGHMVQRLANLEMTEEMYAKVMDVNFKSTVFMCKRVAAGMKVKGFGKIVNMSSLASHNGGGPGAAIYAASKAAISAYSKGLAKELAGSGIHVNVVSPGFIGGTPFHDTFTSAEGRKSAVGTIPLGREGRPEDVAGAVLYLVSDLASFLTGETIEINGGMFMR